MSRQSKNRNKRAARKQALSQPKSKRKGSLSETGKPES